MSSEVRRKARVMRKKASAFSLQPRRDLHPPFHLVDVRSSFILWWWWRLCLCYWLCYLIVSILCVKGMYAIWKALSLVQCSIVFSDHWPLTTDHTKQEAALRFADVLRWCLKSLTPKIFRGKKDPIKDNFYLFPCNCYYPYLHTVKLERREKRKFFQSSSSHRTGGKIRKHVCCVHIQHSVY